MTSFHGKWKGGYADNYIMKKLIKLCFSQLIRLTTNFMLLPYILDMWWKCHLSLLTFTLKTHNSRTLLEIKTSKFQHRSVFHSETDQTFWNPWWSFKARKVWESVIEPRRLRRHENETYHGIFDEIQEQKNDIR